MQIHFTELDCYEDVVEGYIHLAGFQVEFTTIIRDGFAEQIEIIPVRTDDETGEALPGDITLAERNQIIEMIEMVAEDYFHGIV